MPGTILKDLQIVTHISFIKALQGRFDNYLHFVDKDTKAQRSYANCPKSHSSEVEELVFESRHSSS